MEVGIRVIPFNHKMRRARKRLGLTQRQLGEMVELTQNDVSRIERFVFRKCISMEKLVELATFLGLDPDDLFPEECRNLMGQIIVPFETVVDIDPGFFLEGPSFREIGELVADSQLAETLDVLLSKLHPRQQRVLELRFGLNGNRCHTLEETAVELGVTRARIHQIEDAALTHLRHPLRKRQLEAYLDH